MKSKNAAAKKLCGGVDALNIPRKLTCDGWSWNVVGCKTQILIELGCIAQRDLLEKLKENNVAKVSLLKLLTKEDLLIRFLSLACNLMIFRKKLVKRPCGCN